MKISASYSQSQLFTGLKFSKKEGKLILLYACSIFTVTNAPPHAHAQDKRVTRASGNPEI